MIKMKHRYFKLLVSICTCGVIMCFFMTYFLFNQKSVLEVQKISDSSQRFYFKNKPIKLKDLNNVPKIRDPIKESFKHPPNNETRELAVSKKPLTCEIDMRKIPEVDVQMLDLYRQLEFDNPIGGVWTQGWDITYDKEQWNPKKKLKVIVMPHSHNDPGWLKTFENYYDDTTRHILDNMVVKLSKNKLRKFIWAEISFLKMWWDEQSEETREKFKRLIADGQLEIVSGGWVMPDEAVSHWMAQLTQLTVGHQWLKTNFDYQPTSGWAIDPFGLSPTMPYLLKNSGLKHTLIQRVHYAVKKRLAKDRNLEFRWRQLWDTTGSSEMLTHLMPFVSYDIGHSCGPDPNVCCQFDFLRLKNGWNSCDGKTSPKAVTNENIAELAELLLDQYRKKSELYTSDVVLAPLGDDFRYNTDFEWDAQYDNHQKLFDYMNKNERFNVDVKFGTLTDYFNALSNDKNINELPSLSGDFFTYSDKNQDYWSGYYTSRPFHKRLDRVLLDALRGAEILSSIAWASGHKHLVEGNFEKRITEARQWHSLFQHHDGITGTAKDHVVRDYAEKTIAALNNSAHITQQSAAHLLINTGSPLLQPESVYLSLDQVSSYNTSVDNRHVLSFDDHEPFKRVIIYNSLPRRRMRVQTLITSTPFVKVTNSRGKLLQCQISPVWTGSAKLSNKQYELSFVVTVSGFGLNTYLIHAVKNVNNVSPSVHFANITLFNTTVPPSNVPGFKDFKIIPSAQEFSIKQRPDISADFSKSGFLKSLKNGNTTTSVNLEFVKYGTKRSGAYLFIPHKPDPEPINMTDDHVIHLVTGPILSRVFVLLPHIKHTYTLFNSAGSDGLGLHISNKVDITETENFELVMRLSTNISSGDEFFTDLNGLNMIKRQRFSKLPTQANYYPLPSVGYIQDEQTRLTIVTGQPLGAASMASGQFEIMQDRRLMQDDARGLAQGVTDNLSTNHAFMLVLEKKKPSCNTLSVNHPAGALSIGGLLASDEVLHPLVAMHLLPTLEVDYNYQDQFTPLNFDLPVDLSIANLRVFSVAEDAAKSLGIVLHRQLIDTCWSDELIGRFKVSDNGEINIGKLFNFIQDWTINESSLTFNNLGPLLKSQNISLCPHELSAILFRENH
ncbi:alpha-mannosidase 2-like [Microplitis mediator]|uniref:alpha-mannosidase 2-like n=1 Tax=Microplitis mediator TaxID=375433 RepID=UPI002552F2BA|nr:alpha-mannosidase 2-like [Microplitis mediator]